MKSATVIAVSNLKGGVGKTTSTMYLAAAYRATGLKVLVVDLDKQESDPAWDPAARPPVDMRWLHGPNAGRTIIQRWGHRYDMILIDTPADEGRHNVISSAMGVANFVLIPTGTSMLDLEQLYRAAGRAAELGVGYGVLITMEQVNSVRIKEAGAEITAHGRRLLTPAIPRRNAIKDAYALGIDHHLFGYDIIATKILQEIGAPDEAR